jgi:DNA polymerase I-like protein with 3'-5' exonuclease and polymerase domains
MTRPGRRRRPNGEEAFPSLQGQGAIAVDCETKDELVKQRGPGWHRQEETFIAGVAIGTEAGLRRYFPVRHEEGGNMDPEQVFGYLRQELSTNAPKVGANLAYDYGFLMQEEVELGGELHDVQHAEPLLDENQFTYNLERLSQKWLGIGKIDEELDAYLIERYGDKKNPKKYIWRAHADKVAPYAIGDVNHPLEIWARQKPELERQGLMQLMRLEGRLIPMLYHMRAQGVRVDVPRAEALRAKFLTDRDQLLAVMRRDLGFEVNVWAAASVAKGFDHHGLRYGRTKKTNAPSITKGLLNATPHPFAKAVLKVRELDKLVGTFLEGSILEQVYRGRIHTQFHQMKGEEGGTVTGRFSSSDPNLQFIPVRTDEGKLIRSMFLPEEGYQWGKIDYSQIEYRLMAHVAADMDLEGADDIVRQYLEDPDVDFHQIIADMTGLERGPAKTINFGIAYGEGKDKLAASLGLTVAAALDLLAEYHRRAPFMKPMANRCMDLANQTGQIDTLFGRIRRFQWGRKVPDGEGGVKYLTVPDPGDGTRPRGCQRIRTHAALNARIQGSAADIMKIAMDRLNQKIDLIKELGYPMLTVHDELDFSFEADAIGVEAVSELKRVMENVAHLRVPLRADVSSGPNWGKTEDWINGQPARMAA